jgi:hypothetical protein
MQGLRDNLIFDKWEGVMAQAYDVTITKENINLSDRKKTTIFAHKE